MTTTACALLAVGCGPQIPASASVSAASAAQAATDMSYHAYNLTIYGYNYTDTEIGSFEVNGQGGGNLEVSIPTAGGGKHVCCATVYKPMLRPQPIKIKWTRDGDTWCEQQVMLQPPLPAKPEYFEVHFYRDGHIEVAVTESDSPPRLRLDRKHGNSRHVDNKQNINNDAKFGSCKLGY